MLLLAGMNSLFPLGKGQHVTPGLASDPHATEPQHQGSTTRKERRS